MTYRNPKAILFRGLPGVGKTLISNKVAEKLRIAIIRKDDIYDSIYSFVDTHQQRNKICYDLVYQFIDTNLQVGADIIIDCPFREHKDLDKLADFIKKKDGIFKPILCECNNEALWAKRFNERSANPNPNNLITDFEVLKTHYKTLHLDKYKDELTLDTQRNIAGLILTVQNYLSDT